MDLPVKTDPAEFGGGRDNGTYVNSELATLMCSRAGCGRTAYSTWSVCADGNVQRPLCAECDLELNALALAWIGDPGWQPKVEAYVELLEDDTGRELNGRVVAAALWQPRWAAWSTHLWDVKVVTVGPGGMLPERPTTGG